MSDVEGTKPGVGIVQIAGNAVAPFVYFDQAATYGLQAGAVQVELVAATVLPNTIAALSAVLLMLEKPTDPLQNN